MKEKKARVEDALHATRAAVEEGIVPGGGVALIRAQKALKGLKLDESDEQIGVDIVRRAHRGAAPHDRAERGRRRLDRASRRSVELEGQQLRLQRAHGHATRISSQAGVIDPTKVTRTALQNAASIAGLLLTTEAIVVEKKEDKSGHPARRAAVAWAGCTRPEPRSVSGDRMGTLARSPDRLSLTADSLTRGIASRRGPERYCACRLVRATRAAGTAPTHVVLHRRRSAGRGSASAAAPSARRRVREPWSLQFSLRCASTTCARFACTTSRAMPRRLPVLTDAPCATRSAPARDGGYGPRAQHPLVVVRLEHEDVGVACTARGRRRSRARRPCTPPRVAPVRVDVATTPIGLAASCGVAYGRHLIAPTARCVAPAANAHVSRRPAARATRPRCPRSRSSVHPHRRAAPPRPSRDRCARA